MQFQRTSRPGGQWIQAAALALLVCSCQSPGHAPGSESLGHDAGSNAKDAVRDRMETVARGLRSADWEERYDTLRQLRAFGSAAEDLVLCMLEDENGVVRRAAQNFFVGLGETAVPYLVEKLATIEQDVGFYARIAGGTERHEVKSLAGTLWLTLARGTPRKRRFEIARELIFDDRTRIRAVGLFTAATMREAEFLRLLEPIARDEDPMIKDRFWESLVLLLVKRSESAPDLDPGASAQTLAFLEPELVPILNSAKLGAVYTWQTYGSLLEDARVHEDLRQRFVDMLHEALADDRLSASGAVRAGAIIAGQYRDDDLRTAFRDWASRLDLKPGDPGVLKQLAALSSFPFAAYDLEALPRFLDFADDVAKGDEVEARGLPMLAANFLLKAITEADRAAAPRAMASLSRWIAHEDEGLSLEAAVGHATVLEEIETFRKGTSREPRRTEAQTAYEHQRKKLVASAAAHADRLFARAKSLSLQQLVELEKLFIFLGDKRYLDLFELVWSHRWDDKPGLHSLMQRAMLLLADRQEKAILPQVLQCVEAPESKWHHKLRDGCAYGLTQSWRLAPLAREFLHRERLERWIEIIEDPNLYHRTRAGFFPIVQVKTLSPAKRKRLADVILKYTSRPHDSNQRSKAILALGQAGDRRALAPLYAMAMETDHPWWIWENLVPTLAMLHGAPLSEWGPDTPKGPVPKKAIEVLVDLLEAQLATMKPHAAVRFAYPNNYYSWGIEYLVYPPEQTVYFLKKYTGRDFRMRVASWRNWLSNQRD